MRAYMAKEFQAIRFWTGKSLFVAKNNTGRIILELARADKAAAHAALFGAWNGVLLSVAVKRKGRVLHDNVVADPIFQCGSRPRVDVILSRIVRKNAPLLDADQVVRVGSIILLLHGQ